MSAMDVTEVAAVVAADDPGLCRWRPSGEFAMVHPSGWSIARYLVYDEWRYLLWEPVDLCRHARGNASHGPFRNVRDAMRLHRQLALPDSRTRDGKDCE
ncbi:hypothetical protein B0G71_8202 [Paraburkholderia sp. BL27I4N3]|jgi:hypothetical protein|uniref:hypothetical protein n=1 Tax=Paraburkholderia sp. BL27I4N3 TaxID=1938805 RepID=UPI000E27D2D3|nr:hypothetical protein [Paraburkholderia sp. BL27I4N3]REE06524.1 hypothetical protein B0G71_8202 [Paraburkholderia sp. BL27I4N3]